MHKQETGAVNRNRGRIAEARDVSCMYRSQDRHKVQKLYTEARAGARDISCILVNTYRSRDKCRRQELNSGAGAVRAREVSCIIKPKEPLQRHETGAQELYTGSGVGSGDRDC